MAESSSATVNPTLKKRKGTIFIAAVVTTVLALAVEYFLAAATTESPSTLATPGVKPHARSMGIYLSDYYSFLFVPVGAIVVGLAAASGGLYTAARQKMRIRGMLAIAIVLLLAGACGMSRYLNFRRTGPHVAIIGMKEVDGLYYGTKRQEPIREELGFLKFLHYSATQRRFAGEPGKGPGEAIGMVGYLWHFTGLAGFSLAWLVLPYFYQHGPYCRKCERFMNVRTIASFPAGLPFRKFTRSEDMSHEEYERHHEQELRNAVTKARTLEAKAKAGDMEAILADLSANPPCNKEVAKLPRQLETDLVQCADCGSGFIELNQVNALNPEDETDTEKIKIDALFIKTEFLRQLRARLDSKPAPSATAGK